LDALEPHIDAKTMSIHHDNHHGTYMDNLNTALEKHSELQSKSVEDLLRNLNGVPWPEVAKRFGDRGARSGVNGLT